jgi:hypothetical protein
MVGGESGQATHLRAALRPGRVGEHAAGQHCSLD